VLDEPTNGLDPQGTREVRHLVRSLAAEGTTVFVSSHLLAEVEQICTHAAIMSAGRLVAQGTLESLRRSGRARVKLTTPDLADAARVLQRLGLGLEGSGEQLTAPLADGLLPEQIVAALVAEGVRVRGFAVENGTLEERFVALTGEGFDVVQ
jgi:ABC-2 type transport system ATP-binding protein